MQGNVHSFFFAHKKEAEGSINISIDTHIHALMSTGRKGAAWRVHCSAGYLHRIVDRSVTISHCHLRIKAEVFP